MENNSTASQHEEILLKLAEISSKLESAEDSQTAEKIDYSIAVLLGLATILGALAAYFSALWSGSAAAGYNKANFAVSENSTAYLEALTDYHQLDFSAFRDDIMYVEWGVATAKGNKDDADYFKSRMSEEYAAMLEDSVNQSAEAMGEAIDRWYAAHESKLLGLDSVMTTSTEGITKAKAQQAESDEGGGNGDAFTFVTVLFTITLFFGGMCAVTKRLNLKKIYAGAALVAFIYSVVNMLLIPFPPM